MHDTEALQTDPAEGMKGIDGRLRVGKESRVGHEWSASEERGALVLVGNSSNDADTDDDDVI